MKTKNTQLCELNLLALNQVQNVEDAMETGQVLCFRNAFSPYKEGERVYPPQYFENAGLIINAQPKFAARFCNCGVPVNGQSARCNLRKYCPRCAGAEGFRLMKVYGDAFYHGPWHHLTLSFKGNVALDDLSECSFVWDALKSTTDGLIRSGVIDGAIHVEELAIRSFLTCKVLPHAHVVAQGEGVRQDVLDELARQVDQELKAVNPDVPLSCNFKIKPLEDEGQFCNALGYVLKPINLSTPYRAAWEEKCRDNSRKAVELNSETRDVILGLGSLFKMRKGIKYMGNLNARNKNFIGTPEEERRKRARQVALSPYQEMQQREREQHQEIALAE
jgi:hypothetical protein